MRRLRRRCGYAGVRVGEASHPGPGPDKVLHAQRRLIAGDAALVSRRPTGFQEVTEEEVFIRESEGKWVNRNPHNNRHGEIWWCEKYYVQVVRRGLRDYSTEESRERGFIVGTNVRFFKRKYKGGTMVKYKKYGYEFPLTPTYTEDDTPERRPALRITLGTKLDEDGERVVAKFYVSTVLGYCHGERSRSLALMK